MANMTSFFGCLIRPGRRSVVILKKATFRSTGGVFTVSLNFGLSPFAAGAADSLEIGVRPGLSTGLYTTLTPRQPLASSPFTIRSLSSVSADSASDSAKLGGVAANQYVITTDPRMTDERNPLPGSNNYIQSNPASPQSSGFDVRDGHFSGTVRIEANGLIIPTTPSLSLSSNGSFSVDAPFLPGGRFMVLPNGNVGIGTGAPSEKLDVAGSVKVSGDNVVGGNVGIGGLATGDKLNVTGTGVIRARINSDSNGGISFALNNQPKWSVAAVTGGDLQIFNDSTGQLAMSVNGSTNTISGDGSGLINVTAARSYDPKLLGMLRWDLLPAGITIPVDSPSATGFDGTFVYVASTDNESVTRIRASTGQIVGAPIPISGQGRCSAFDGTFIYIGTLAGQVFRIRASTGLVEGTPITTNAPSGMTFDGTFVYISNQNNGTVTRINASTGLIQGAPIAVGNNPIGLVFDGIYIYVANGADNTVSRIRASNGLVEGSPISIPGGLSELAFDGTFVYVVCSTTGTVTRIRTDTGLVEGSPITFGAVPTGITFDGTFMFVVNQNSHNVSRIRTSTGLVDGPPIPVGTTPGKPLFDGTFIYVVDNTGNTVSRFRP